MYGNISGDYSRFRDSAADDKPWNYDWSGGQGRHGAFAGVTQGPWELYGAQEQTKKPRSGSAPGKKPLHLQPAPGDTFEDYVKPWEQYAEESATELKRMPVELGGMARQAGSDIVSRASEQYRLAREAGLNPAAAALHAGVEGGEAALESDLSQQAQEGALGALGAGLVEAPDAAYLSRAGKMPANRLRDAALRDPRALPPTSGEPAGGAVPGMEAEGLPAGGGLPSVGSGGAELPEAHPAAEPPWEEYQRTRLDEEGHVDPAEYIKRTTGRSPPTNRFPVDPRTYDLLDDEALNELGLGRPSEQEIMPPEATIERQPPPQSAGAAASPYRPPPLLASEADGAQALIRQQHGLAQRDTAMAVDAIENRPLPGFNISMAQAEARASQIDRHMLRSYVEQRTTKPEYRDQLPPELQAVADLHRSVMQDRRYEIESLDPEQKQGFIQDYLPHIWDLSTTAKGRAAGARFLKERTIPTYEQGIAAGLTPKYDLISDIDRAYISAMDRFNASRAVEQALKEQGHIIYPHGDKIPDGWERIATGRFRNLPAYAPRSIARDYNRFYAEGAPDWVKTIGAIANDSKKLAFAGGFGQFHAVNELNETLGITMARIADNLARGQLGRAAKSFATPVSAIVKGARGYRFYTGNPMGAMKAAGQEAGMFKYMNPEDAEAIDILTQAHGVPSTREFLDINLGELTLAQEMKRNGWTFANLGTPFKPLTKYPKTKAAWQAGERGKVLYMAPAEMVHGALGTIGHLAEPLFNYAIPRLKMGTNILRWQDWKRSNPFATKDEQIAMARKIADASDNLYGEMNRDNLTFRRYLSKSALQAMDAAMLAPGWNIGSAELFARGVSGVPRAVAGPLTRRIGLDPRAPSLSMASEHWDPNITAAYGSVFSGLVMGGIATWFMTGKPPQEPLDYVAPRTGGTTHKPYGDFPARIHSMGNLGWGLGALGAMGYPSAGTQGEVPGQSPASWMRERLNPLASTATDLFLTRSNWKGEPNTASSLAEHLQPFAFNDTSGYTDPNLPLWARIMSLREAGMEWIDPQGYAAFMRRKYGAKKKRD